MRSSRRAALDGRDVYKRQEEILAKGVNDSLIHVDFMVGSDDLHIVGIHEDGSETDVFVNGTWVE